MRILRFCLKALLLALMSPALFSQTGITHFAVIGDYGSNNNGERQVAELLKTRQPEFIITVGDNNYPNGCWESIDENIGQYYHTFIGNYQGQYGAGATVNRFFPTLGNHDWNAASKCTYQHSLAYLAYFELPGNKRYYDFVKGPIHFFALDSDRHEPDGNTINSAQYQWFAEKIKASKAAFKIVYFHHPPYSSGEHGPNYDMQWPFADLGADLVIAGHEHDYERIEQNGIVFIVNGIGGPPRLRDAGNYHEKNSKLFYSNHYGFLLFKVTNHKLKMQMINDKNEIIDSKVIVKKHH